MRKVDVRATLIDVASRAAVAIVTLPALALLAATAGFALGKPVGAWCLFVGALGSCAVALGRLRPSAEAAALDRVEAGDGIAWSLGTKEVRGEARRESRRESIAGGVALLIAAGAWGGAFLAAGTRRDVTWDGQTYHQEAVIELARGWNPLRAYAAPATFTSHDFVTNMAKGSWTVAAAIDRLGGGLERAKLQGLALGAAAFLAVLAALLALTSLSAGAAAACALLAALNPVAVCQAFSFYVDGQVGALLTAFLALAGLLVLRGGLVPLLGMVAATIVLASVKLTGVPYAVLAWAIAAAAALLAWDRRAGAALGLVGAAAVALSVLGPGWNPYVTNTLHFGHPFYPVAGPRGQDIVRTSRPEAFAGMTRFGRLGRSIFAVSASRIESGWQLKVPFTLMGDEATKFHAPDVRLGGFGPFFSGALVLSIAAVALARRRAAAVALLLAAAILATVLVTAEGWWARFAPQLWLVPLVLALAPLSTPGRRGARWIGAAVLLALAVNVGVVGVSHFTRNDWEQRALERQLDRMRAAREPVRVELDRFEAVGVRLTEAGVRWTQVRGPMPCPDPEELVGSFSVRFCPPE